jgi:hypothetical protein
MSGLSWGIVLAYVAGTVILNLGFTQANSAGGTALEYLGGFVLFVATILLLYWVRESRWGT